ncbi:hypothetical protein [Streptomyces zagrosensis]|uniref:Uncharacterized protein n=1 Tax=Streptomyces zagrosensis TaxID=1042984 RepID=A0A7W9QEH9_9ACTN|nr:hypothetical protein [Streptomyces zagrosensis]MBB5938233.1 hypothetical protein [Streptomyces zagrosensis]
MATSKRGDGSGVLRYLESRKNLTGCALGLLGLGLYAVGVAGAYWPVVIVGLYGAGALLAPPERPHSPDFPAPGEQVEALRADLVTLDDYLAGVRSRDRLPDEAERLLDELAELLSALLDPERGGAEALAADGEALHRLTRIIRQDAPQSVDAYLRTRWWSRLTPGASPPDDHLRRQLGLLVEEGAQLAAELRDAEAWRQQALTQYYEDRATPDGRDGVGERGVPAGGTGAVSGGAGPLLGGAGPLLDGGRPLSGGPGALSGGAGPLRGEPGHLLEGPGRLARDPRRATERPGDQAEGHATRPGLPGAGLEPPEGGTA